MSELITISMTSYRRPSLLLNAIHSCFRQDYRPLEIDISDDSPTTDAGTLVRTITPPPGVSLRYFWNSPALGQSGNVNRLFAIARGSRLLLLHDDDLLLPGAISALNAAFSSSPSVIAAYGLQQVILQNGEFSEPDTKKHDAFSKRGPEFTGLQTDVVKSALWLQFPNNGYLIDSAIARAVGYRKEELVGDACDADFAIRVALENRNAHFAFLNRYTSQYRLTSVALRLAHNACGRSFEHILAIKDLTPVQVQARDELLRKSAEEAVVDNALQRRRKQALRIFLSPFYPTRKLNAKSAYHLGLIALPGLLALRERFHKRWGNRALTEAGAAS